ncbi:TonB-dependent receptor [Pseudoduganella albidiflava]|uniref:TonB-dependent receptor n=2 Tax=Pseudoduganella albidiflava TaxID=321983 RepID=A0AA87XUG6_9BURK|nr:TonB-dependent receptor [Pseudoduganella albidiflava]GGY33957.1 TonB-dependent receptor [Pseudoduganella albidiflava]
MTTISFGHTPPSQQMKMKLSVAVLAGAGILSSASVWAQNAQAVAEAQATSAPVSVVVTGVRRAAQSAQTIKRNSDEVIDSIVAEEAGKFPDKNVAEILGRVTGVQIRRSGGEAADVIIRGLPGLTTLLNGREVYTSTNRNLHLADIPTTMLQRVDVYKTQGAEMVEGGTAGVIDVRTARPFDFKGFSASLSGRGERRDKADTTDPQVSGMISNRWKNDLGEFGALFGVSYQKGHYFDEVTWNSPPDNTVTNNTSKPNAAVTGPVDLGHSSNYGMRERYSANWAFQFKPARNVELLAEGWSTRIDHDRENQFFLGNLGWGPTTQYTLFPGTNQVDTVTSSGNPFALSSNQTPRDDSETHQAAIGAKWTVTPDLRVSTEFVRTTARWKQDMPIMEMLAHPTTIVGQTYVNGGARFDYPGYNMLDPNNYTLHNLIDNWQASGGQSKDWRADATYNNGEESFFREFSAGVRIAKRSARYQHESLNFLPAVPGLPAVSSLPGLTCPSQRFSNDYGMNQWLTVCGDYQHANIDAMRKLYGRDGRTAPDPYSLYTNNEDTSALYGKTRFGFNAGPVPVEGTVGVRVVKTKLDVNGFSNVDNQPVAVNKKSSDTDVLPNLTLKANLTDTLIGRVNAGKTIQRPAFGDFNPGISLGATPDGLGIYGGNGGNPDLKPVTGKNADVALEWYFAPTGSLTATVFKHKFENYIIRSLAMETFDGKQYRMDRPRNVNEGQLEGVEIGYRQFYDFLPGWLGGFGLEANYTYMKGHFLDAGKEAPFQGMSKNAFNVVGLYERGPWSARLAYNYRSRYVDTFNYRAIAAPIGPIDLIVDPIETVDASLSYKFNEHMGITLDVENLTDRTYNDYHGIASNPRDVRRYDRVIGLTLRWKL